MSGKESRWSKEEAKVAWKKARKDKDSMEMETVEEVWNKAKHLLMVAWKKARRHLLPSFPLPSFWPHPDAFASGFVSSLPRNLKPNNLKPKKK